MRVQVFGRRDSRDTQKALRFFKERRIEISFVDIATKPPAPAELRRFVDHLGPRALLDEASHAYRDQGMAYLRMDDSEVLERVLADPRLLRLPLVRVDQQVAVGPDDDAWRSLVSGAPTAG